MDTLQPPRNSLFRRVLRNMAMRIVLAGALLSALSYYCSYVNFQEEALANLAQYISARSQLESELFVQAEANTKIVRDEFLRRYVLLDETDPAPAFYSLIAQDKDRMWRVRVQKDDFERKATIAILPNTPQTPTFMRQVLLGYDILSQYGPAFRNRYYDTFIDFNVSDCSLMYLPDLNYARNGSVADFAADLEVELGATPIKNVERKTFWTSIYFDRQALRWMVSVVTPLDYLGKYIGGIGQDVLLDQLIERNNKTSIPGTYNITMTRSGELIAHPDKMDKIKASQGHYKVQQDPVLKGIYEATLSAGRDRRFVETPDGLNWLGVAPIEGANWLFVTVYPKKLLQEKAAKTTSIVLLLGMLALVVELFLMTWVLKKEVAKPLSRLNKAINALATGASSDQLDIERTDELGDLARNFDDMSRTVQLHRQHLEKLVDVRTGELASRNEQLEVLNDSLVHLNKEKNELLAIAAHDLKNPIASIQGMAHLIAIRLDEWPRERVLDRLAGIGLLADRTQGILSNLLDHEALESGSVQIYMESLCLNALLLELLSSWEERLAIKQQVCLLVTCNHPIWADRQALWQVLDNLLSNASKYSPQGSVIHLNSALDGEVLRICVVDQGPGVAPHEISKLFLKFSRLSALPTGGEHTTGLGLSIVKRLVEAMQGRVYCQSQFGSGATFVVELQSRL
ncbi:ATP-binding protein [Iodobacter sp.]|uniref:ATP-binding response regulator n=1 Tax=Iodobacter sp. TaxID=1915058 RepID=UPI0025F00DF6|nr:ATP-binding protein [Iodobacter sp.]